MQFISRNRVKKKVRIATLKKQFKIFLVLWRCARFIAFDVTIDGYSKYLPASFILPLLLLLCSIFKL